MKVQESGEGNVRGFGEDNEAVADRCESFPLL